MENSGKCVVHPDRDCHGYDRAEEVARDVKALDRKLTEFQQNVANTNNRFGERIGRLEARNEVQDEQVSHIKEALSELRGEIRESQKEQRDSMSGMRSEQKEAMAELKKGNQESLSAVTTLIHKVEGLEYLKRDVDEIKAKPAKTWEGIKEKGLNWMLILILTIVACALGLSKYL